MRRDLAGMQGPGSAARGSTPRDKHGPSTGQQNRRRGLVAVGVLLCSVASALPAVAGAADAAPEGYLSPFNAREFAVPLDVEESSPAEIEASETAHADVAPADTGALAERSFPEIFAGLGGGVLPESVEVLDYRGESAALVQRPGEAGTALMDASLPLRVAEGGEKRPVELGLEAAPAAEEALVPARPLVDVSLPEHLDQGIEVAGGEFTISVAGAADAGPARPLAGGDAVIYPGVATDTDFLAAPTLTGLEVFAQLRSVDSPQQLTMPLDLPPGARLEETAIGGAQIIRDEQRAAVLPPLASDADGNPVEVEMSVEGGALALAIPHRQQSVRYPVLVDPVYDFFSWNGSLYGIYEPHGADGWIWQAFATPGSPQRFEAITGAGASSGLYIHSDPGSYPYGTVAHWMYAVPHSTAAGAQSQTTTTAHVSEAWMNDYWHGTDNPPVGGDHDWAPFVEFCLVDVGPFTCITGQSGNNTAYMSFHGAESRFEANSMHVVNVRDTEGRRNQEVERVGFGHASDAYPNPNLGTRRWSHIGSASVAIEDGEAPTVTKSNAMTSGAAFPTGWTNSTANARVTVTGQDGGLGVKTMRVGLSCDTNGTCAQNPAPWAIPPTQTPPVNDTPGQCQGTKRTGVCPQQVTRSHTYSLGSLPEGLVSNYAQATDALAKTSPLGQGKWQVRIDRSGPVVAVPTGSFTADADRILRTRDYELSVLATDGSTNSDAQMRSGVELVEVFVDSEADPRYTAAQDCTVPNGSCLMPATWQIEGGDLEDLAVGPHTVRIVATDGLGHKSERSFPITLRDDPDEAAVTITAGQPAADGSYQLSVTGRDPPVADGYGSGVERLEIYMDGELIDTTEQQCRTGSCPPLTWSRQMSGAQSLNQHEASVVAYDRAGNASLQYRGHNEPGRDYDYFGYNEFISQTTFNLAKEGGANVFRFPVDWCAIAPSADPSTWSWDGPDGGGGPDAAFAIIHTHNVNNPENPIATLPVLGNAPLWARNEHEDDCQPEGINSVPPRRTNLGLNGWRTFVTEFVARYGPGTQRDGNIVGIEVWNEPNLAKFWGSSNQESFPVEPGRWAELVTIAGEASSLPVLPGGLATAEAVYRENEEGDEIRTDDNPGRFMARATNTLDFTAVDALSFHLYANKQTNTKKANQTIQDRYEEVRQALPTTAPSCPPGRCFDDLDRWLTEVGFPSDGTGLPGKAKELGYATEPKQHQRLRNAYHRFSRKDIIKSFIVHHLRDARNSDDEPPAFPGEAIENGRFGTVHREQCEQGARKWIYCWLAERVAGVNLYASCEPKRPSSPHGQC